MRRTTQRWTVAMFGAVVLAGLLAGGVWLSLPDAAAEGGMVHKENSLYHQIFVYREGAIVTLSFRKRHRIVQSRVDLRDPRRHMLEYSTLAFASLLYRPRPKRVLVIGLGGGVIPREIRHYLPGCHVDVVEIDPAVPKIARRFFRFRPDEKLKVHVQDGRLFVRRHSRREGSEPYDIVILDAFNSDYIPFHLMTREFLEQVEEVLAPDGVVAANVFSNNRLFDAEWRTFDAVLGRTQVYFGRSTSNAFIMAPGRRARLLEAEEARRRAAQLQERHEFPFDLRQVARRLRPDASPAEDAQVLTDDRAPVNKLRLQKRRR
jgi:spermidine synthase